ncbi:MAG: hypothetical protein GTO13_22975 [Proteobacteria bacterium]|nr:hypothetical protein [Pseudomonadota bacterium]
MKVGKLQGNFRARREREHNTIRIQRHFGFSSNFFSEEGKNAIKIEELEEIIKGKRSIRKIDRISEDLLRKAGDLAT